MLNSGKTASILSKELSIPEKKFRKSLKECGYSYDNSLKRWAYHGEMPEPLDKSIFEAVSHVSNTNVKSSSHRSNKRVITDSHSNSHEGDTDFTHGNTVGEMHFTQEEYFALKELAKRFIDGEQSEAPKDHLHTRITQLIKENRTRKTIVIGEGIAKQLDNFTKKTKFAKSDIVELALVDFIKKYDDEE